MATDKERREVAERMREFGNEYLSFYGAFIGEAIGITCGSDKELWHRLADLIEPVPTNSDEGEWTNLGSLMEVGTLYACSEQMHDAAKWVEENGGLEAVKARLMPEGMEWPRFDTGEPVRIGDFFEHSISGHHFRIHNILFTEDCAFIDSDGDDYLDRFEFGERVKSSPEKALDAYGMECNKGDTVWLAFRYRPRAGESAFSSDGKCGLAGVGKYDALKIKNFFKSEDGIFVKFDHYASPWCPVSWLTHKNPDTWAELEEDMRIGVNPTMDERIEWFERAKVLAESGE